MGPIAFEKKFAKRCGKVFNETKVLFFHNGNQTIVKYPYKNKLLGIQMYREDRWLDQWINYFIEYLETGEFDTHSYWKIYTSSGKNFSDYTYIGETQKIPMVLKDKLWSEHSPEFNKYMKDVRSQDSMNGVGFNQQPKPLRRD